MPKANENGLVPLGLPKTVKLPIRFTAVETAGDQDVVVISDKIDPKTRTRHPGYKDVMNLYGHDAKVTPRLRRELVGRWPNIFQLKLEETDGSDNDS